VSAPGGLVWVDHSGKVVGRDPVLVDDAGVIWSLDLEIGDVSTLQGGLNYWTDAGCTGLGVMLASLPREAVRIGNTWRVRPDALPSQLFSVAGFTSADGGCSAYSATIRGVPVGATQAYVNAPDTGLTGPLHRELR
jgi:hypothetical protein